MNLFFSSKCRRQGMHSGNKAKDRGKGKDKREAVWDSSPYDLDSNLAEMQFGTLIHMELKPSQNPSWDLNP